MVRDQLLDPAPEPLLAFFREHLRGPCLVLAAGACEVLYHGRAASTAEAGDYLVMLKPDGSLQIHGQRGVKPVNWQPRTDDLRLELDDGRAVLVAERFTPSEWVRVAFLEVALVQALELGDSGDFVLSGSEAEMQRALARRPELIEPGLTLLDRELPTDVGGIDLFARDREGRLVVVELKRGKAGQEAVHQLMRYVESVRGLNPGATVRGVLAAPGATAPALVRLGELGLEFCEVTALEEEEEVEQPGLFGGEEREE